MSQDQETGITTQIRTLRLMSLMLMLGPAAFGIVVAGMRLSGQIQPNGQQFLTLVMTVCYVAVLAMHLAVPRIIQTGTVKRIAAGSPAHDEQALLGTYRTVHIMAMAFLEAGAFLMLVAFWIEGRWLALVLAGSVCGGMLARFPSEAGVRAWLRKELETIAELRLRGTP